MHMVGIVIPICHGSVVSHTLTTTLCLFGFKLIVSILVR